MHWYSAHLHTINILLTLSGKAVHQWIRTHEATSILTIAFVLLTVPALSAAILIQHPSSLYDISFAFVTFFSSLSASILLYRLSPFHPLGNIPGPTLCKLSKLWLLWVGCHGKIHVYIHELHSKYGPIIRIGITSK